MRHYRNRPSSRETEAIGAIINQTSENISGGWSEREHYVGLAAHLSNILACSFVYLSWYRPVFSYARKGSASSSIRRAASGMFIFRHTYSKEHCGCHGSYLCNMLGCSLLFFLSTDILLYNEIRSLLLSFHSFACLRQFIHFFKTFSPLVKLTTSFSFLHPVHFIIIIIYLIKSLSSYITIYIRKLHFTTS